MKKTNTTEHLGSSNTVSDDPENTNDHRKKQVELHQNVKTVHRRGPHRQGHTSHRLMAGNFRANHTFDRGLVRRIYKEFLKPLIEIQITQFKMGTWEKTGQYHLHQVSQVHFSRNETEMPRVPEVVREKDRISLLCCSFLNARC